MIGSYRSTYNNWILPITISYHRCVQRSPACIKIQSIILHTNLLLTQEGLSNIQSPLAITSRTVATKYTIS